VIDAAPKLQLLSGEVRRERVVTPEKEVFYLAAAPPLLAEVATVLFDTGMRPDELHRMQWENVTWKSGRHGTILIAKGKTNAARRVIPMTLRVSIILADKWTAQGKPRKVGSGRQTQRPVIPITLLCGSSTAPH
jgi:integrase